MRHNKFDFSWMDFVIFQTTSPVSVSLSDLLQHSDQKKFTFGMNLNHRKNGIEMKDGVPVSLTFGDVYFSKEGGWEESRYVFWEGNRIPKALSSGSPNVCTVGELGFGTGLNFFVSLEHWLLETNPPSFQFYSLEGFPLPTETLQSLNHSFPGKALWTESLLQSYDKQLQSWKEDPKENVWKCQFLHNNGKTSFDLNLLFGDVKECLVQFPIVDFWYLDGFSPSKNPSMWSEEILSLIGSHSQKGTRLATFTSAGFIRRFLESLGFTIEKQKGFGKKREMITGVLQ